MRAVVCGSAHGSVQLSGNAVAGMCGSACVLQCAVVRQYGSVRQCMGQCVVVCGCVRLFVFDDYIICV